MQLLPKFAPRTDEQAAQFRRQLIRREAKIGGNLFGAIPKGHHREFFCLDTHTWVWHEEWQENGQRRVTTTYYNVRPEGFLKSQGNGVYQRLSDGEARNLYNAIRMYRQQVASDYQQLLQAA